MRTMLPIMLLTAMPGCYSASGQSVERHSWDQPWQPTNRAARKLPKPGHFETPDSSLWAYRWYISPNVLGILELPQPAFGVVIGFRLNRNVELFSETSRLIAPRSFYNSSFTGFREIFKIRYMLPEGLAHALPRQASTSYISGTRGVFFLGVDLRYKQYSYRDSNNFTNSITQNTLRGVHFLSKHSFFGFAGELGYRWLSSGDGRWQMEFSLGVGAKFKTIERIGAPAGYIYQDVNHPIDLNVWSFLNEDQWLAYFPGSVRLLWCFGKMRH